MKINPHSQNNNLSFGVKMSLKNTKIKDVRKHIRQVPPRLVVCQKIHIIIANKINKSADERPLNNLLHSIKTNIRFGLDKNFIYALKQSKKSLEIAFFETCDKLFDVQLYKN